MRICAAVLVLTAMAGSAPAAVTTRVAAAHAIAHPLARLRVAADRAIALDPVEAVGRLPAPLGWMVMLGGFGVMGAALRGIRRPPAQALDAWRVGGTGAPQ